MARDLDPFDLGKGRPMSDINDDDIQREPTEDEDNLDAPGEHSKDTGDEPTEAVENLDGGGEGPLDTGDEA